MDHTEQAKDEDVLHRPPQRIILPPPASLLSRLHSCAAFRTLRAGRVPPQFIPAFHARPAPAPECALDRPRREPREPHHAPEECGVDKEARPEWLGWNETGPRYVRLILHRVCPIETGHWPACRNPYLRPVFDARSKKSWGCIPKGCVIEVLQINPCGYIKCWVFVQSGLGWPQLREPPFGYEHSFLHANPNWDLSGLVHGECVDRPPSKHEFYVRDVQKPHESEHHRNRGARKQEQTHPRELSIHVIIVSRPVRRATIGFLQCRHMPDASDAVRSALESAGFFTSIQPIPSGDRVVCASRRHTTGERARSLGGTSFWIAHRGGQWFIATWSGAVYRVRDPERVIPLCLELLNREEERALNDADLNNDLRSRFGLTPIDPDAFGALTA